MSKQHILPITKYHPLEPYIRPKKNGLPEKCPVCGTKVVRTEGEVDYRCVNANCPAELLGTILHFASRGVMNIDGMGESLVNQLIERGLAKNVADIYALTKKDLLSPRSFRREVGAEHSRRD